MIKRIMTVTLVVALVLAQSGIAGAFTSDKKFGFGEPDTPFLAAVTPTGTPVATLNVTLLKRLDDSLVASKTFSWSGVSLSSGWKSANEYLDVDYAANQLGWGIQVYTDNTDTSAIPKYAGDPSVDPNQQPVGLIGATNKLLTCPTAVMVLDENWDHYVTDTSRSYPWDHDGDPGTPSLNLWDPIFGGDGHVDGITKARLEEPVVTGSGDDRWFTSGYDADGDAATDYTWFYMKDKASTVWNASTSTVDPTFTNGDDVATIVNTLGSSSGWTDAPTSKMIRVGDSGSPLRVYLAADFENAGELQSYETNSFTVELYHD